MVARTTELNDGVLITCLDKHLDKLHFPRTSKIELQKGISKILSCPQFNLEEFSLFSYSTKAQHDENLYGLNRFWKTALQGALYVLKEHDLRENPTRLNVKKGAAKNITLPPIDEISSYYENAVEFEYVLYGVNKWYRDHFAHVIRVWLLGLYVIFELNNLNLELTPPPLLPGYSEALTKLNKSLFAEEELYAAFTVAALTHDLGYPLEQIAKLNQAVAKILESFGGVEWQYLTVSFSLPRHATAQYLLKFLGSHPEVRRRDRIPHPPGRVEQYVEKWLSQCGKANSINNLAEYHRNADEVVVLRSQWKYYDKYTDSLEKNHHGLLSALLAQRKLVFFKEGEFALEEDYHFSLEEARQFIIRREILRAIASHTCPDIYFLDPLNIEALLFFCDEIQEWGRPFFKDLYGAKTDFVKYPRVRLNNYNRTKISWEVELGDLQANSIAFWVISSGRKLYKRLRSGPESKRDFLVEWTLFWRQDRKQYTSRFVFDNNKFSFKIGNDIDIIEYLNRVDRGENVRELENQLSKKINQLVARKR